MLISAAVAMTCAVVASAAAAPAVERRPICAPRAALNGDRIMSDAPKSAFELAMERLRKKDAEAGIQEQKLTDQQKAAIAEARSIYEARVAERQILHRSNVLGARSAEERETIDEEYRRDLDRFASDRDAKIRRIRDGEQPS
ncbi:MAG: hypothetical protein HOQ29_07280 [Acidobacteria bacterium]|nr:hypothetical protein [Acidobacteriota bacterium]